MKRKHWIFLILMWSLAILLAVLGRQMHWDFLGRVGPIAIFITLLILLWRTGEWEELDDDES